jgi:hypothetical protein
MSYTQIAGYYLSLAATESAADAAYPWPEGDSGIQVTNALVNAVKRGVSDTNRLIQEEI